MYRALTLFAAFALSVGVAAALAQEASRESKVQLAAAFRDAQRLADCFKALDSDCVVSLWDTNSEALLRPPITDFREMEARSFGELRQNGGKYELHYASAPQELFTDGGRLYTFVPYVWRIDRGNRGGRMRVSITYSYFIAFSVDEGKTWTFVDGAGVTEGRIRLIIPSYAGQPLPPTAFLN